VSCDSFIANPPGPEPPNKNRRRKWSSAWRKASNVPANVVFTVADCNRKTSSFLCREYGFGGILRDAAIPKICCETPESPVFRHFRFWLQLPCNLIFFVALRVSRVFRTKRRTVRFSIRRYVSVTFDAGDSLNCLVQTVHRRKISFAAVIVIDV